MSFKRATLVGLTNQLYVFQPGNFGRTYQSITTLVGLTDQLHVFQAGNFSRTYQSITTLVGLTNQLHCLIIRPVKRAMNHYNFTITVTEKLMVT